MSRASILLVSAEGDYEFFRQHHADFQAFEVYAARPSLAHSLMAQGVTVHTLGELMPPHVVEDHYAAAFRDARSLVSVAEGCGEINLARFFLAQYWEMFHDVYALDWALRVWGLEQRPVLAYMAPAGPAQSHMAIAEPDRLVGHALDHYFLEHSNIKPLRLSRPREYSLGLKDHARDLVYWLGGSFPRPPRPGAAPAPGSVVAWGAGHDAFIVLPEARKLAEESGRPAALVGQLPARNSERTGLVADPAYETIPVFDIQQDFNRQRKRLPVMRHQVKATIRRMKDFLAANFVGYKFGLATYLTSLRRDFFDAAAWSAYLDGFLAKMRGSTIVLTDFNGVTERAIEQLAARHGIEVVARPHGWIANPEGYVYETGQIRVPGTAQRDILVQFGADPDRILVAPDRHLEDLKTEPVAERPRRTLVILAVRARNRMQTELDPARFAAAWDALLAWAARNPSIDIIVKPHPTANYDSWLDGKITACGLSNMEIRHGRLESILPGAGLVVDFGAPGTAALATMLLDLPLVAYGTLFHYTRAMSRWLIDANPGMTVQDSASLTTLLDAWVKDGDGVTNRLREANRSCLAQCFTPHPESNVP